MALVLSACGGDDASGDVTTTVAEPTTTMAPVITTTAPATTTTTTTTTTAEPAGSTDDDLAETIVLPSGFFGADWEEVPQTESDLAYSTIEGCEFVDDLADADGNSAEAESPEFSQFDTMIEHDARVYPTTDRAIEVVLAWVRTQPSTASSKEPRPRPRGPGKRGAGTIHRGELRYQPLRRRCRRTSRDQL